MTSAATEHVSAAVFASPLCLSYCDKKLQNAVSLSALALINVKYADSYVLLKLYCCVTQRV